MYVTHWSEFISGPCTYRGGLHIFTGVTQGATRSFLVMMSLDSNRTNKKLLVRNKCIASSNKCRTSRNKDATSIIEFSIE